MTWMFFSPLQQPAADHPIPSMHHLIVLLLVVSASAKYNYGHLYLPPTYEDYYGGYYGHHYGGYNGHHYRNGNRDVPTAPAYQTTNRGQVAVSPNIIQDLSGRSQGPVYGPSTIDAIGIAIGAARQRATPAATPAYAYAVPAVTRAVAPSYVSHAAAPVARYIPGHPYGAPAIYGYSSGAYTYYSPSVLSPYSYGSYGSYGSYHSDPYGYLYKK